ncbi:hypothetical protein [Streptomyces chromofuscus]|uniref:LigA protein n=1 Tax=Streptomyces chromofuscus TaxID=42881 RepID=A0A7M2T1W8_STRCW|nr:hypothetical protein [Streptomyces chromofuscus]QOV42677.1 hypothetical protein IPT68_23065 [Streptomyces chromofuscus]GGS89879.1 hypothetical protein GCM10010254_07150 [Streptomyces chromofuscus]
MPTAHQENDPFEDRLGAALRQTGDTFDTDRPALIAAGHHRGRTLRLRRRAAVAGGAASIALVGIAGALVLPGSGSGGDAREQQAVGSGPRTSAPATSAATRAVSAERMIATLRQLLPEGAVSGAEGSGGGGVATPSVRLVYDDGEGGGAIAVSLNRVEPGSRTAREAIACPDKVYVPHDSCTSSRLSDGSVLMLFQGYEYPDRRVDTRLWRAELVTPEGEQISVSEWNAEAEKDAPVTRPEPPLSLQELRKVATASQWRALVPAEAGDPNKPETTTQPSAPAATFNGSAVDTLVTLLPKKAEVVSKGGEGDFGYVVVDDGRGQSLVQINVQPRMGDVAGELFTGAGTLPDGTLVSTRKTPGEKGGEGVVMWTADTLRTDGLRVVISAFNSGSQHTAATREAPALTLGQLRELALDPMWPTLLD